MRQLLTVIAVLLGLAASAAAAELKIASWNIAWLNKDPNKGMVKRTEADYARLKAYADRLDADIVALAEVQGTAAARRVFDPERYNFHFEQRRSDQMVGFAIKKSVKFKSNPDYADLSLSSGLRRGVDITVSVGDKQLRLLAVHLKSGCFNDTGRWKKTDCETFHRQIPILEQWIDARASENLPFFVLGDFNHRFTHPNDSVWTDIDDSTPPNADLTDEGAGQTATCWNTKYPEYIDHIVADLRASKLVVAGSFKPMLYDEKKIDDRISDHCPISVRVAF